MSDRDKDIEILALRHQLLILQRQVGKPTFTDTDRAVLVGLLHYLPQQALAVVERGDEDVQHGLGAGTERHGAYRICELFNGCLRLTHRVWLARGMWLTRGLRIIRCAQIAVGRRPSSPGRSCEQESSTESSTSTATRLELQR